jgi:hypothetical protein
MMNLEPRSSFATAARAVRVSVLQLLRSRLPYVRDLNVEHEVDPSKRMVGVEQHLVAFDGRHGDDRRMLVTASLKLITDVQFAFDRQLRTFDALNLLRIPVSVSLGRRDLHSSFFTELRITQFLIEPRNNLAGAFKIRDRIASRRGIKHPVRDITESVVKGDDAHGKKDKWQQRNNKWQGSKRKAGNKYQVASNRRDSAEIPTDYRVHV